jgi:SAM-dependent methyltransferase
MNEGHAALCASPEWATHLADEVLPGVLTGVLTGVSTGAEVLEIGPGYGAATAYLTRTCQRLTAVEIDERLAGRLARLFPAVTVVVGSGTELPFPAGRFATVLCFTMLHHVHSPAAQDALFAEARRVLAPGGAFAGSDSVASPNLRAFHAGDTYVPVDPDGLPDRLRAAGFTDVHVTVSLSGPPAATGPADEPRTTPTGRRFAFSARAPRGGEPS